MNNKHLLSTEIKSQNESNDYYCNQFISVLDNQNQVITDNRYQREVLLEKLMDESIPTMDVVKKAVEKDNDQLPKEDIYSYGLLDLSRIANGGHYGV